MENTRRPDVREAEVGWVFDVVDRHPGASSTAEILEVIDVPGYRMFRVRWNDGSESTFLPSHDRRAHPPMAGCAPHENV